MVAARLLALAVAVRALRSTTALRRTTVRFGGGRGLRGAASEDEYMQAVGAKLKEKSARLASRRRAIAEEHASRVGSGNEVYRGDGLLLDNKLD